MEADAAEEWLFQIYLSTWLCGSWGTRRAWNTKLSTIPSIAVIQHTFSKALSCVLLLNWNLTEKCAFRLIRLTIFNIFQCLKSETCAHATCIFQHAATELRQFCRSVYHRWVLEIAGKWLQRPEARRCYKKEACRCGCSPPVGFRTTATADLVGVFWGAGATSTPACDANRGQQRI